MADTTSDDEAIDRKPPAAVAAAPAAEEDDRSEDTDDWSRRVETDESSVVVPTGGGGAVLLHFPDDSAAHLGSVVEEDGGGGGGGGNGDEEEGSASALLLAPQPPPVMPPPTHPELSLKERLVLRERQRRIETERARWKRQFALSNGHHDGDSAEAAGGGGSGDHDDDAASSSVHGGGVSGGGGGGGSATEGTLGEESTRAHPDEDAANQEKLGFNMERFLRNSVTFDPQLDASATAGGEDEGPPPLLERFLNEPVVVGPEDGVPPSVADESHAHSFDSEGDGVSVPDDLPPEETPVPPESFVSFGEGTNVSTNASVVVEADEEDVARDPLTPMASMDAPDVSSAGGDPSLDEPRVLRLTEADMQEMAAIEEASIGNAPPSEREEEMLSEIGELADFGAGPVLLDPSGNFSQGTATTAVESASLVSAGNHSAPQASSSGHAEAQNLDGFLNQLDEAHTDGLPVLSSAEGSGDGLYLEEHPPGLEDEPSARMPPTGGTDDGDDGGRTSPPLVNRVLRPGMVTMQPHLGLSNTRLSGPHEAVVVEGFDFDKDAPTSPMPSARGDDSFRDLPMDVWSPPGKMHVSPISFKGAALPPTDEEPPSIPYMDADARAPATAPAGGGRIFRAVSAPPPLVGHDEGTPLLIDVPSEVRSSLRESTRSRRFSIVSIGSIFSDVRSEEEGSKEEIQNESEFYLHSSILSRAFPERMFALTVTLIFEIPVLLMISGGSDALCELVGRSRYQLLMGFIPLTSAISGNVGLQASTLTTRAISHCHVTPDSYVPWFLHEIGAACVLGAGMGLLLGSIAYFASGMDMPFGLTILLAQFISIVTAGCTGTFAPLLFSFIFRRDSGKWGGPLETAIQDIVGSFAMVIISYHILKFLGPGPIDPSDVCSPGQADDLS